MEFDFYTSKALRNLNEGALSWEGDLLIVNDGAMGERYDPLSDDRELFLRFAELGKADRRRGDKLGEADKVAVEAFAYRYGILGGDLTRATDDQGRGESLLDWISEADDMALALKVLENVREQRSEWLKNAVKFNMRNVSLSLSNRSRVICSTTDNSEVFELIRRKAGDYKTPAFLFLQQLVNRRLRDRTRAYLGNDAKTLRRLTVKVAPLGLIGAIWLQLAQHIDGGPTPKTCKYCGKRFIPTRSHAQFCSAKHRVYYNRKRVKDEQGTH